MKKLLSLLLPCILLYIPACTKVISTEKAEKIVTEYNSDAVIKSCTLSEEQDEYEILFDTPYDSFVIILDSHSGDITSVSLKEEEKIDDPTIFEDDEPEPPKQLPSSISFNSALNIALNHSGAQGSASVIAREFDEEAHSYKFIFRSLNTEYIYEISSTDGTIINHSSHEIS